MAFASAIFVAAAVFYTAWDLLGARGLEPERLIDAKTLFDLVKLSFGVVAGAGALVALIVAYRRQRVDEDGALREATRLHTERFTTAVSQLGEESAAVRLGGVHALAGLADDAPTRPLRQTCIDVLCAYLRLPYIAEADLTAGDTQARHAYLALREVRHTVIRLIRDHLRLDPTHPQSWQGHDFDFTGVTFDGGDFSGSVFSGGTVSFSEATFSGGTVRFSGLTFSGGRVDFGRSTFSGGTVRFSGLTFSGGRVGFGRSTFSGATVRFSGSTFSGGTLDFGRSTFSGGTVSLNTSTFSGGMVGFAGSAFCGGTVRFFGSTFCGGRVDFRRSTFSSGTVRFAGSTFSGGTLDFGRSTFSGGTVRFVRPAFTGGTVDFRLATGEAPSGLVPASGSTSAGLFLPSAWLS
ncbi:pentapeptide repeat-containing protein [Streptomyces sp. NPDC059582]|uniref:pentapeptide repeat-containing protein n=1 Tax=Streptomyces sp. NPDC059582 TaxID=3346875 RepID=UPI0036A2ABF7